MWYASDRPRHRRGFTLFELIVVVAIIATLASIVAPSIMRNTGDARRAAALTQIEAFGLALDAYQMDVGSYPAEADGLGALQRAPSGTAGWRGPYLRKGIPLDPWGHAYEYRRTRGSDGHDYLVRSLGRDGREGGQDEDRDVASSDSTAR